MCQRSEHVVCTYNVHMPIFPIQYMGNIIINVDLINVHVDNMDAATGCFYNRLCSMCGTNC